MEVARLVPSVQAQDLEASEQQAVVDLAVTPTTTTIPATAFLLKIPLMAHLSEVPRHQVPVSVPVQPVVGSLVLSQQPEACLVTHPHHLNLVAASLEIPLRTLDLALERAQGLAAAAIRVVVCSGARTTSRNLVAFRSVALQTQEALVVLALGPVVLATLIPPVALVFSAALPLRLRHSELSNSSQVVPQIHLVVLSALLRKPRTKTRTTQALCSVALAPINSQSQDCSGRLRARTIQLALVCSGLTPRASSNNPTVASSELITLIRVVARFSVPQS